MKVKAKVSFAGTITMGAGDEGEILDEKIVKDLVAAGYVEVVNDSEENAKKVKVAPVQHKNKGDDSEN